MGQWDIPIIGGVLLIGGYFIITNLDAIKEIFSGHGDPIVDGEEPPVIGEEEDGEPIKEGLGDGNGNGNGNGNGGEDKPYDCARACRNCWCKSYSENCDGKCSRCCGGSRIASKCGGQGVKSCGGGSGDGGGGGGGDGFSAARAQEYPIYPYQAMRLTIA